MDENTHEISAGEHLSAAELKAAEDPAVGAGTPDTAPHEPVPVTMFERQPAAVIGTIVAVIDAVLVAAVQLPEWLTAVLVAVVTITGALRIRSQVTPSARPRDDDGNPLTP